MKRPQRSLWLMAFMGCTVSLLASAVQAQTQNRTGSSGLGGMSAGGSSGISGSNSFGGGTNRFSSTNANQASASQSVFMNQQSNFGFQGGQTNQNGFLGGRNTQTFLGGNQRDTQANNQQQNQFGNRNNRGRQGQMDVNDPNRLNQQGQTQDSRRAIRPQQKVAFDVPRRSQTELSTILQTRFEKVTQQPALNGVSCELAADGVVTLRGSVESTSARQLAANVVRLEPGVRKVVNELTVQ